MLIKNLLLIFLEKILRNGKMQMNYQNIFIQKQISQSIDSYYFDEFFTAIYNTQIDDRPITDIFLFLPSRKVN